MSKILLSISVLMLMVGFSVAQLPTTCNTDPFTVDENQLIVLHADPCDETDYLYSWTIPSCAVVVDNSVDDNNWLDDCTVKFYFPDCTCTDTTAYVMISNPVPMESVPDCIDQECVEITINCFECDLNDVDMCVSDYSSGDNNINLYPDAGLTFTYTGDMSPGQVLEWYLDTTLLETDNYGGADQSYTLSDDTFYSVAGWPTQTGTTTVCATIKYQLWEDSTHETGELPIQECTAQICLYWTPQASITVVSPQP